MHQYTGSATIYVMTTKPDRREQRRLATREQLLEAAEKVFGTLGFQQATILDITEAANVSKRTFYLHFADKDALLEALAQEHFARVYQEIDRLHEEIDPHKSSAEINREKHYKSMERAFAYCAEHPDLMQAILGKDASYKLNAMARDYIATTMERELLAECPFRPDAPVPPEIVAHSIAGMMFQLLSWWVQHPNRYSPQEMAAMSTSMLYDSVEINFMEAQTE